MDPLTKEQRRKNMQAIKSKDTIIEVVLRKELWSHGIRYRKNYEKLCGRPDIVLTKYKIAVFCDSEFWHGYNWNDKKKKITTNPEYWIKKIENNMRRDEKINSQLSNDGWIVIRFWGKDIKKNTGACYETILQAIRGRQ